MIGQAILNECLKESKPYSIKFRKFSRLESNRELLWSGKGKAQVVRLFKQEEGDQEPPLHLGLDGPGLFQEACTQHAQQD